MIKYSSKMSDEEFARALHDESVRRSGIKMRAYDALDDVSKQKWIAAARVSREIISGAPAVPQAPATPLPAGALTFDLRSEAEKMLKFTQGLSLASVKDQKTLRDLCYALRRALRPGTI